MDTLKQDRKNQAVDLQVDSDITQAYTLPTDFYKDKSLFEQSKGQDFYEDMAVHWPE